MSLTKDRYKISFAALQKLDMLINYNLENIHKYVQKLENGEPGAVEINIYDNERIECEILKRWTCSKCKKDIFAMEIKMSEYNFCPHCGIGLKWVG